MRAGLAFAIVVVFASPAHAACRLHSIWNYPWKQRCAVAQVAENKPVEAKPKVDLSTVTISKYDTLILAPKPGRTDEEGRAEAIELLKQVMGQ